MSGRDIRPVRTTAYRWNIVAHFPEAGITLPRAAEPGMNALRKSQRDDTDQRHMSVWQKSISIRFAQRPDITAIFCKSCLGRAASPNIVSRIAPRHARLLERALGPNSA